MRLFLIDGACVFFPVGDTADALYFGTCGVQSALLRPYVLAGLGAGGVTLAPIVMIRAFPAEVRFSGLSFAYYISYAVFGGMNSAFCFLACSSESNQSSALHGSSNGDWIPGHTSCTCRRVIGSS
jgi:hypothetical protein